MDPVRAMILSVVATGVVIVLVVGVVMWACRRWIHRWVAVAVGGAVFVIVCQQMVSGMMFCAADPVYVPPTAEAAALGSEGAMRFNCDSLGGAIDYFALYRVMPLVLSAIVGLVLLLGRRPSRRP